MIPSYSPYQVCWEDFAFFDPVMYETFRKLLVDAKKDTAASIFESLSLTFYVVLSKEEGGKGYDLIPNGALHPVTPDNVLHYVSRYAYLRMVHVIEEPLQVCTYTLLVTIPLCLVCSVLWRAFMTLSLLVVQVF